MMASDERIDDTASYSPPEGNKKSLFEVEI